MRVSRAQAAENRQAVIDVASRLFRASGFDGVGLKSLMESAGLTQGAFYKQFASKEDLVRQAASRAMESAARRCLEAAAANPSDPLGAIVGFYLSKEHSEDRMDGCPIVSLGSDAARQSVAVKASFEAGVKAHLNVLESLISRLGNENPGENAMAILSTMIGALMLSRVLNDPDLAQSLLGSAAGRIRDVAGSKTAS